MRARAVRISVITLLRAPGMLFVSSRSASMLLAAPAGAIASSELLQPGQKAFAIVRTGASALAGVSLRDVGTACPYGILNYGAFVSVVSSTRLSPRASRP
jgi:hypothetical protein